MIATKISAFEYMPLMRDIASGWLNRQQVLGRALSVGLGTTVTNQRTAMAAFQEQAVGAAGLARAPTPEQARAIGPDEIDNAVDGLEAAIRQLGIDLWNLAEPSLLEVKSGQRLTDELTPHGFRITSTGTAGHKTAFVAEWGSGAPRIGFLAEYDALPGLGNASAPRLEE